MIIGQYFDSSFKITTSGKLMVDMSINWPMNFGNMNLWVFDVERLDSNSKFLIKEGLDFKMLVYFISLNPMVPHYPSLHFVNSVEGIELQAAVYLCFLEQSNKSKGGSGFI